MSKIIVVLLCLIIFFISSAQSQIIKPDLMNENKLQPVNRRIELTTDQAGKTIVHVNANDDDGIVWIKDLNFTTGIIEFDVKGKDVFQESFVGIAFHGMNDSTFESVYFRPFNFQADDTTRKKHAVQYIAPPKFDWEYLRETYPGKYEHSLLFFVNPNKWFHVKVIVEKNKIQAFINADSKPCISIEPLTHNYSGKIGFWVGNGSDGDFSNLTIRLTDSK